MDDLRQGIDNLIGKNIVLAIIDGADDLTDNPGDAYVTERRSKHWSDKRPPSDSVEHPKSLWKRRQKSN